MANKLNFFNKDKPVSRLNLTGKFDSLDMRSCWNAKVMNTFSYIDRTMSTPLDLEYLKKPLGLSELPGIGIGHSKSS